MGEGHVRSGGMCVMKRLIRTHRYVRARVEVWVVPSADVAGRRRPDGLRAGWIRGTSSRVVVGDG